VSVSERSAFLMLCSSVSTQ